MILQLQILAWLGVAVFLGITHLLLVTAAATSKRGVKWNMSSRDQAAPALTGKTARLERAFKNFQETFPFFLGAVVVAIVNIFLSNSSASLPVLGCQIYVIARLLYIPAYVFNLIGLRTLIWTTSMIGIGLVLLSGLQIL